VAVITAITQLTKEQIEGPLFTTLDIKEGAVFYKYLNAANNQIMNGDEQTKALLSPQALVKLHLKIVESYGNAVIFKAILVKTPVL